MPLAPMFCARCHREYDPHHRFCPYDGDTLTASPKIDLVRPRHTELKGSVLGGRYEVKGFIGKGAMARVYLAEDLETHEPVAVKVLEGAHARGNDARERFLREARAASMIGHPNIIEIRDVGLRQEDGAPYLVLEFLFGESLGDLLRREKTLTPDIGLPILGQAASGLAAAHEAGIVHRDVKPDNLFLLGEPGDPYAVKVLDFGLAKLGAQSGLTAAGVAVGTMEYMAPEQVVSDTSDARTDIYGLGVVMFRMFTGQLPFQAKGEAEMLAQQLVLPPPAPSSRNPGIDPAIEIVILSAIRKHPENRYASMRVVHEEIERLLGEGGGPLVGGTLRRDPDVYVPKNAFAKNAARFLYKKIGKEPPNWV